MQSLRPVSPLLRQHLRITSSTLPVPHRRTFVQNLLNKDTPHTFTASRTLPYPNTVVYAVISDVASYSQFLPYCTSSTVTHQSDPHPQTHKQYPQQATLEIGFPASNISESFTSRVTCVPDTIVEATSGQTKSTIPASQTPHHTTPPPSSSSSFSDSPILTHLLTKWVLRPFPYKPAPTSAQHPETTHKNHEETSEVPGQQKTEVNLTLEFQFANPMYGAIVGAAAPKLAEMMMGAFEGRVKRIVEGPRAGR